MEVWILVGCDSDGKPDWDKLIGVYDTYDRMVKVAATKPMTVTEDGDGDAVFCYHDGTSSLAVKMPVSTVERTMPAVLAERYPDSLIHATVRFFGGQLNTAGAQELIGAIEYAVRTGPTDPRTNDFVVELGKFLRQPD